MHPRLIVAAATAFLGWFEGRFLADYNFPFAADRRVLGECELGFTAACSLVPALYRLGLLRPAGPALSGLAILGSAIPSAFAFLVAGWFEELLVDGDAQR